MRILIVEDNAIALQVLHNALVQAGHEVQTARGGQEALEIVRSGDCSLVVSDWEMPGMSGVELFRAIRAEELPTYVYLILLTSHDTPEEKIAGLNAGADDFMTKPFDPAELIARIRAAERMLSLETRDVAIFAMAKLAESRDSETGAHLERVQRYCRVLAHSLQRSRNSAEPIDDEFVRLIYLTSPLHDIGKVGIPDCVLLKPGRLSDREFEIMKTHAMLGAQTLDAALRKFPSVKFLQMARDIAATHHERFDGTGYPAALAGKQIPLSGRIVALADVYDALTSKRVYKDAFGHDVARSIILKDAGTHFDPDVINAFIESESEFSAIREQFAEARLVVAA
ncbi:MAG: response regulator receiver modulated metal dependent phosphohydrolase [Phycisphaerales bacterium]|jgi:putative two-component system response regulator|nr:response regulator receiver modulated metal dependent phosphohydrolase [Phycisphaerales bacterium]